MAPTSPVFRRVSWSLPVAAALVVCSLGAVVTAAQVRTRPRPNDQRPNEVAKTYTRADAELVARRLYRAALGREADAPGLSAATADIQRGNLLGVIQGMTASSEFRSGSGTKQPSQLLEHFYQVLFERAPDSSGVQASLGRLERGEHAGVLFSLMTSPEFEKILATPPVAVGAAAGAPTRLESALECQARVIEAVRRDAGGRIFLTFDRMPTEGAGGSLQGPAVDRFNDIRADRATNPERDRPLTYRCDGASATYSYSDRKPPVAADARLEFPSAAVRACQAAVRGGLVFDAASLSASDTNAEYVLGLAGTARHQCQMNGTRVVSVK
jgi:hypothetical protein